MDYTATVTACGTEAATSYEKFYPLDSMLLFQLSVTWDSWQGSRAAHSGTRGET